MEIGDLLYILIGVGALLFSLFKKSKHKEQFGNDFPQYEQEDNLEEVFESVSNVSEQPQPKAVVLRTFEKKPVFESKFKRINFENRNKSKKIVTSGLKIRKEPKMFFEEKEDEIINYWNAENFDLHKAVIYSEILKRPNFDNSFYIR
ncbi:MAG: hypothetical protein FWH18_09040 [Marinilabiliaceae bacterium]|nr:hypothetical protein [Marinilabiliaceae bacterium]